MAAAVRGGAAGGTYGRCGKYCSGASTALAGGGAGVAHPRGKVPAAAEVAGAVAGAAAGAAVAEVARNDEAAPQFTPQGGGSSAAGRPPAEGPSGRVTPRPD